MIFLSLFLGWSFFASTDPQTPATSCVYSGPAIHVTADTPVASINHSQTRQMLAARLGNVATGFEAQGMTSSSHSTGIRSSVIYETMADGKLCANLQSVDIGVGYAEAPTVYIASEITEGSCRYRSTIAHEYLHVGLADRAVREIAAEIDESLGGRLALEFPMIVADQDEGQRLSLGRIQSITEQIAARHLEVERVRNLNIDTRTSYEALTAQCPSDYPF